jgi:hypothetical protein
MNPHYPTVSARARHACEYCRAPEVVFNMRFEIEHIRPQSQGGKSKTNNLALACRSCNLYKSDHLSAVDEQTGRKTRLFNPRRDAWRMHFSISEEDAEVKGLTAKGRVTVERLQMNSRAQLEARREWLRLGLMNRG